MLFWKLRLEAASKLVSQVKVSHLPKWNVKKEKEPYRFSSPGTMLPRDTTGTPVLRRA